tara:strand:+ start:564 stop:1082 length:519 start_codon:yes stop_codon:yes gene_type:complete
MDISYWIFILIVYLISQWIQSRTKKISNQDDKLINGTVSNKNVDPLNENLPEWIKNLDPQGNSFQDLNFNQTVNVIDEIEEPVDVINEVIDEIEEPVDVIDEDIEETEVNFNQAKSIQPIIENIYEKKPNQLKNKSFNIYNFIHNKNDLKKAILLNEILSKPRAINKYKTKK